jgi:hypothetical protein
VQVHLQEVPSWILLPTQCRFRKQRKHTEAVELLVRCIELLINHEQYTSAVDLCMDWMSMYTDIKQPVHAESLGKCVHVLRTLPPDHRKAFTSAVNQWTVRVSEHPAGSPQFHHVCGLLHWEQGQFVEAERHFFHGDHHSAKSWAIMLTRVLQDSNASAGSLVCRPVLQYLSENKLSFARVAFTQFIKHIHVDGVEDVEAQDAPDQPAELKHVYKDELLNCCQLLLDVVQRDARDLFIMTRDHYAKLLKQDAGMDKLLDAIGRVYFNIQRQSMQNPLQQLMQSMLSAPQSSAGLLD